MTAYFEHYPVDPEEIAGISAQLFRSSRDIHATVAEVKEGVRRGADTVDGDIRFPMENAPGPAVRAGSNLLESAQFAGGAMLLFAEAVTTYNTRIDGLNAEIGTTEKGLDPGGPVSKLAELEARRARYAADLDDAAARVARMLKRGPNAADETYLRNRGLLPSLDAATDPALQRILHAMPHQGADPEAWARWWASLTLAQQVTVMALRPDLLGNANGLPAEVRDEANRIRLAEDYKTLKAKQQAGTLTEREAKALQNIEHVMSQLDARGKHLDPITGQPVPVQLYIYDPYAFDGDGRVAISTGDLDDADHISVNVPGVGSSVRGLLAGTPHNIYDESRWASGEQIAVLDWMGYDSPNGESVTSPGDVLGLLTDGMADDGARRLADDVAGLRASRPDDPAHLTVIGSSYGSSTAAIAAEDYGLRADDLVLIGSPGVNADDAADLSTGREHTWVGSSSKDPITSVSSFSTDNDPAAESFGANRFRAELVDREWAPGKHHGGYDDKDSESLYNIAAIVTKRYGEVLPAEPRPNYNPDPEQFRTPQHHSHAP